MEAPNFTDMPAEDLLTLIEDARKEFDHKIAAEKADIAQRQVKLAQLEARRAGKVMKPKGKKPKNKLAAAKPRGRPASVAAPKSSEQADPEPAHAN